MNFRSSEITRSRIQQVHGTVLHPTEGKLSNEDQFSFRSGTGKLLPLMKWSRPEISNAVRELSRWMNGAGVFTYEGNVSRYELLSEYT
jgi:hypothetical protein